MHIRIAPNVARLSPSLTLTLSAKALELKKRGVDVCSFTAGEPDCDTPHFIRERVAQEITKGGMICRYTASKGMPELRETIVRKFKRENGLDYTPNQIIVGTGAKQVLAQAIFAVAGAGDEVLVVSPYWVSYPDMVLAAGAEPKYIDASGNPSFAPTGKQIRAALTPRTRALILNSPSNPTGGVFTREQLVDIYRALEGTDVVVISDEIYEYLVFDQHRHVAAASASADALARTVTVNGMSKAYAMTGWRIGYAGGPQALIDAMDTFQSHFTSNATTASQYASRIALESDGATVREMRISFEARRNLMMERLRAIPKLACAMPGGAFYAFPDVSAYYGKNIKDSIQFAERLLEDKAVAVVPGIAFGADKYIRLSYATSPAQIEKGMARLAEFVQSL